MYTDGLKSIVIIVMYNLNRNIYTISCRRFVMHFSCLNDPAIYQVVCCRECAASDRTVLEEPDRGDEQ